MLPKTLSRAYIYHELFVTFDIDINNAQNGISPSSLRDYIAAGAKQNLPLALGLFANGILHPHNCPARVDRALGAPVLPLDGIMCAANTELHRNHGHTVEISNNHSNLIGNTALVSTVPNLFTQLAADPTLETLGPHAVGDTNTEVVCSHYIIPISFKDVNIFLASGITLRRFFLEVYPLMVTDQQIDQDCQSLIHFMQTALTIPTPNQPSVLKVTLPVAPPCDTHLLKVSDAIIQHHFSALNNSLVESSKVKLLFN